MKTKKPRFQSTKSDYIPKPDLKKLDDIPAINIIMLMQNDINHFIQQKTELRKDDILQNLANRYSKTDMCDYLRDEITTLRTEVENEMVTKWYNMLTKKYSELRIISQNYAKGKALIDKAADSEPDLYFLKEMLDFSTILYNKPPKDFTPQKIDEMLRKLAPLTKHSKRFEDVLKDAKPHEAYFTLMLFIHYEKKLLLSLIDTYKQIENGQFVNPLTLPVAAPVSNSIKWLGNNETEFVQLVYALKEAGYIGNGDQGIEKLIEEFADRLNFKIGSNWHVNHSSSIHRSNADYVPEIFDKIKAAYMKHRLERIEKKKKM